MASLRHMGALAADASEAGRAVASQPFWYHTMELAPGVVTPGWFDLRPIVDRLPWPDVSGKRCLDVGPYDGFLSLELERRGAAKVVATDIGDPSEWDWAYRDRKTGPMAIAGMRGAEPGRGFEIAKRILGSKVERVEINAYDLTPERLGIFDVVVCGSLMLHLRDPVRALEAVRGVCGEWFLSAETISPLLSLLARRTAVARMRGGERGQWLIPNVAGHRQLLASAGFEIERTVRPYAIPFGPAHPARSRGRLASWDHLFTSIVARGVGVPHAAALCRPIADNSTGPAAGDGDVPLLDLGT